MNENSEQIDWMLCFMETHSSLAGSGQIMMNYENCVFKARLEGGFEQPGLVCVMPAHGRGAGTSQSLRYLPTQTILCVYYKK